jgi:hypothetical protein
MKEEGVLVTRGFLVLEVVVLGSGICQGRVGFLGPDRVGSRMGGRRVWGRRDKVGETE